MDVARELAEAGAPEGVVVVAGEQTAGRGRASHTWYSPPGQSLYASILLRPPLTPAQAGWVTMTAALAVAESISSPQSPVSIKWFNDVHLGGRKVCGILVESSITGDQLDYAVLGIGLNVNPGFDDAPADVRARATSLRTAWGLHEALDCSDILMRLLAHFESRYLHLLRTRVSPAREYATALETLGREVRIQSGSEIINGLAVRIEEDGALIVRSANGDRRVGLGEMI